MLANNQAVSYFFPIDIIVNRVTTNINAEEVKA